MTTTSKAGRTDQEREAEELAKLAETLATAEAEAAVETAEAAEAQAAGLAAANEGGRFIRAASKEERAKAPAVEAAWKGLQKATSDAPCWGPAPGIRLTSASEVLQGSKAKPATVERRLRTLVRAGMPAEALAAYSKALVRYHEALSAAGLLVSKADAVAVDWDDDGDEAEAVESTPEG